MPTSKLTFETGEYTSSNYINELHYWGLFSEQKPSWPFDLAQSRMYIWVFLVLFYIQQDKKKIIALS